MDVALGFDPGRGEFDSHYPYQTRLSVNTCLQLGKNMLLTELANTPSMNDWQFEVMKDGSNGGVKGDTLGFEVFSQPDGAYYITPMQIKQYFNGMVVGDVRIVMSKSGSIKVARSK